MIYGYTDTVESTVVTVKGYKETLIYVIPYKLININKRNFLFTTSKCNFFDDKTSKIDLFGQINKKRRDRGNLHR